MQPGRPRSRQRLLPAALLGLAVLAAHVFVVDGVAAAMQDSGASGRGGTATAVETMMPVSFRLLEAPPSQIPPPLPLASPAALSAALPPPPPRRFPGGPRSATTDGVAPRAVAAAEAAMTAAPVSAEEAGSASDQPDQETALAPQPELPPSADFAFALVAAAPAAPLAPTAQPAPSATPAAPPASSPAVTPPTYATRLPPAARLEYELRRGPIGGTATLRWLPVADRYTLSLEGGTLGFTVLSQSSDGGYDRAGIAPRRFVDRRRGRDARAANFQRDLGRITFSGPDIQYALLPGSQDRLSWMLQAAAIINAAPGRFVPGSELSMFVAGARGDADVWTFDVVSREAIELPAGTVNGALRLKREPRKPYDTEVEVWLDPARQYLPVRLRLAVPQSGESTDFALRSAELR